MGTLTKGPVGEQDLKRWDGTGEKTFARETSSGGRVVLNKIGHEVDALISYGQGTNYTAACINAAITAIGSVVTRLILRPGTWDVNANITFPANITAVRPAGCILNIDSGVTVTFNGPHIADAHSGQTGDGTIVMGSPSYLDIKNTHVQLKGDARLVRFKDTGASGKEWGIRSDGGNFEICENTGTEASPTWTARSTITTISSGDALTVNMRGDRNSTKCWFYQNTAPTGWTIDETPADALLCVKGGSNAYNTAGGAQAGTWIQPNHQHSAVTLTAAQSGLPAHTHNVAGKLSNSGTPDGITAGVNNGGAVTTGAVTGGAQAASESHIHGATATANTWRPLAQVGIIATMS